MDEKYFKMIKIDDDTMECDVKCEANDIIDFAMYFMYLVYENSDSVEDAEKELNIIVKLAKDRWVEDKGEQE